MRKLLAVVAVTFLGLLAAAPAHAGTKTLHQSARLAYAQWLTVQEIPGAQRITVWFLGAATGTNGTDSNLYYERDLCAADQLCIVEEVRAGYLEHLPKGAFQIDATASRARLDVTFDMYLIAPTGEPVGPATPTRTKASWTAVGSPESSTFSQSNQRRCSEIRESGTDTSRLARAFATAGTTNLGKATEARLSRSTYNSYEKTC